MSLKYDVGQMFYIGSEEPPANDFVLYDKIVGREEYTESEGEGINRQYRVERFDANGESIRKITLDEEDIDESLKAGKVEMVDSVEEAFRKVESVR